MLKTVTNLEDGKQLPAIIDVFWALVVKQEPVDGQKLTHLTFSEMLKWKTSYKSEKRVIKKLLPKQVDCFFPRRAKQSPLSTNVSELSPRDL